MIRIARSIAPWLAVAVALLVLWVACRHGPKVLNRAATALDDPLPGRRVMPTPAKMRAAQAAWRRRRAE